MKSLYVSNNSLSLQGIYKTKIFSIIILLTMKKTYLVLLACMLSTVAYADNKQTVKIDGNVIDKVVTEATIDGTAYTTCVKMESSTSIKLVLDKKVTATFYFADSETASMKIAGTKIKATGSSYTTTLEAGTHEITKDKLVNLFAIKLVPAAE